MAPAQDPDCHILASAVSALVSFPLWRASAIAQSGFQIPGLASQTYLCSRLLPISNQGASACAMFAHVMKPPYPGALYVLAGMTWARATIFFGSDSGRDILLKNGAPSSVAMFLPPLVLSTLVQILNQPIVRGSIAVQWPGSPHHTVVAALRDVWVRKGFFAMWHGTSAGVMKTVPKYCTTVLVKDIMEEVLAPVPDHSPHSDHLIRSAKKSVVAGVAGATLTNPFDVIRNEMFKSDQSLMEVLRHLNKTQGWKWIWRGVDKNLVSVAVPLGMTIFLTDAFIEYKHGE
eukprot:c6858_g1_i1.p1 GENE.c6858_g1_i1~~c6858_g1_i1.p1  ORF type:complete len:288 (+),score=29.78 c6858_g1_i1:26-889(+)